MLHTRKIAIGSQMYSVGIGGETLSGVSTVQVLPTTDVCGHTWWEVSNTRSTLQMETEDLLTISERPRFVLRKDFMHDHLSGSDATDKDALATNHFLWGREGSVLPSHERAHVDQCKRYVLFRCTDRAQTYSDAIWSRWLKDYVQTLNRLAK